MGTSAAPHLPRSASLPAGGNNVVVRGPSPSRGGSIRREDRRDKVVPAAAAASIPVGPASTSTPEECRPPLDRNRGLDALPSDPRGAAFDEVRGVDRDEVSGEDWARVAWARRRATDGDEEVARCHREIVRGPDADADPGGRAPPSSMFASAVAFRSDADVERPFLPSEDESNDNDNYKTSNSSSSSELHVHVNYFASTPGSLRRRDREASARRILDLNRLAVRRSRSGSTADARRALDALHEAEWTRCRLADELAAAERGDAAPGQVEATIGETHSEDEGGARRRRHSSARGISKSFAAGGSSSSSAEASPPPRSRARSPRRQKCLRRSASFDGASPEPQRNRSASSAAPEEEDDDDVARTSYIYQRMDFDEGMRSFPDLEDLDDASFWLPCSPHNDAGDGKGDCDDKAPRREVSPAVEATLAFNVGQIGRRAGDLDAASTCYDRALAALRASTTSIDDDSARTQLTFRHPVAVPILHNVGQLRYRRGDAAAAWDAYSAALDCAKDLYGDRHHHVASALNCLGVLRYHEANNAGEGVGGDGGDDATDAKEDEDRRESLTDAAMDLFQRALSIRREVLGPDHVDVATTLNNVGRIHVQRDEFDLALSYYEDALRIRRESLGTDSPDYAATAFNAGQSLHQRGELGRAAALYKEFLRVALARFGNAHRDVAVVLSGMAQIHQERREHDRARELYEASLRAGVAALGEDHAEVAMLLNRMGNFHFELERLDDALRCYRRGLQIERKVLPPDHPNIVVTLSNLGEIHRQRNEWDEAAKMYGDCLEILRRKRGGEDGADDDAGVASVLSTLGLIHDQRGDSCLGLRFLRESLAMRRRVLGDDHLDVSATLVYVGTILFRKGALTPALELFDESLRIRKAALGDDHRDVAYVLYNVALVHQQRGCHEEASEAYSETLRIERLVLGDRHRDVSMTLFKLGEARRAAGDLDGALQCFRDSLSVERSLSAPSSGDGATSAGVDATRRNRQQQEGADHAAMARALNEIGNIHLARGEVVPMMEAFNEASRLFRAAGLSPNNVVVSGHLYALEFSCPEAAPAA